ncbi:MAG: helix-turn-helix domain-containing protein [Odoribacter sp.]|nr:helix-turn-helix domain-containing protein [Odoribacter sp.]
MDKIKLYTHEEMLDRVLSEKGTSERDSYESRMNSFLMGEAIKKARLSKNLTQEQLGNMIGVKRAQVSRIEKGNNLTFATVAEVFMAMGTAASFEVAGIGKVDLW